VRRSEAARLFVERAVAALPSFALTDANAPAVVQVCRRLDGIPLALELAAARLRVLSAEEIAGRLDDRFGLLTGGSRTARPRQQTLRAALDWSHDLLSEPERVLLRRLAPFAGGWTLEAAEAVCGAGEPSEDEPGRAQDVFGPLAQLVDKSLVVAEEQAGVTRYRLLETMRQYAAEKLEAAGEAAAARGRHLDWYLRQAERTAPGLQRPEHHLWLARLEVEHENLRAALGWAEATEAVEPWLRLAGALVRYWETHGDFSEGRRWLEGALQRAPEGPSALRANALAGAGILAYRQGNYATAEACSRESLAIARARGDTAACAGLLNLLGMIAGEQEDYDTARSLLEQ